MSTSAAFHKAKPVYIASLYAFYLDWLFAVLFFRSQFIYNIIT